MRRVTAKEKLLERAPHWSEAQASAALRAAEQADVDFIGLDGDQISEILDGIPGSRERARQSLAQARRGETIPLDEL